MPDEMKAALYALVPQPFNTSQAERVRFALHVGVRCLQAAHGRMVDDFEQRWPELHEVYEEEAKEIFNRAATREEDRSAWQQTATPEEYERRETAKTLKAQEARQQLAK